MSVCNRAGVRCTAILASAANLAKEPRSRKEFWSSASRKRRHCESGSGDQRAERAFQVDRFRQTFSTLVRVQTGHIV